MEVTSSCPILSLGGFRSGKHGLLGMLRSMLRLSGVFLHGSEGIPCYPHSWECGDWVASPDTTTL